MGGILVQHDDQGGLAWPCDLTDRFCGKVVRMAAMRY